MLSRLKERITKGEPVLGSFVNFYSPTVIEMMGLAGYDFYILDNEHGCFNTGEMENMIRAADLVNMATIVRVDYDNSGIQKALDLGAAGIQVPMVNNKGEAERAVSRAKYPPNGRRGAAGPGGRNFRLAKIKGEEFFPSQNKETLVVVQIETPEAVSNFEEIVKVPGVDVAFIGAGDLSVNMGSRVGPGRPDVQKVVSELYVRGKKAGIPMGAVVTDGAQYKESISKGTVYLTNVLSGMLTSAFSAAVKAKNELLK